jgi:DNA repair photolyase
MKTKQPIIGITERGDAGLNFYWEKESGLQGCDGVILITKHLSDHFIQRAAEYNSIVHATITGHGGTVIEPKVLPADESAKLFGKLVETLGIDRVVLRIDPIIPTFDHVATAKKVYEELKRYNTRIRISFMDNYPHVRARFQAAGLEPLRYNFHAPLASRKEMARFFPGAEICGEPGMECTGCVSERDLRTLGIEPPESLGGFQRPDCKCLAVKRELLKHRGQCASGCLYCYWK